MERADQQVYENLEGDLHRAFLRLAADTDLLSIVYSDACTALAQEESEHSFLRYREFLSRVEALLFGGAQAPSHLFSEAEESDIRWMSRLPVDRFLALDMQTKVRAWLCIARLFILNLIIEAELPALRYKLPRRRVLDACEFFFESSEPVLFSFLPDESALSNLMNSWTMGQQLDIKMILLAVNLARLPELGTGQAVIESYEENFERTIAESDRLRSLILLKGFVLGQSEIAFDHRLSGAVLQCYAPMKAWWLEQAIAALLDSTVS